MSDSTEQNGSAVPTAELAAVSLNDSKAATPAKSENSDAANGGSSPTPATGSFKDSFKAFSKFGDTKSDGKHISLSQSDKWMKQAKVWE